MRVLTVALPSSTAEPRAKWKIYREITADVSAEILACIKFTLYFSSYFLPPFVTVGRGSVEKFEWATISFSLSRLFLSLSLVQVANQKVARSLDSRLAEYLVKLAPFRKKRR